MPEGMTTHRDNSSCGSGQAQPDHESEQERVRCWTKKGTEEESPGTFGAQKVTPRLQNISEIVQVHSTWCFVFLHCRRCPQVAGCTPTSTQNWDAYSRGRRQGVRCRVRRFRSRAVYILRDMLSTTNWLCQLQHFCGERLREKSYFNRLRVDLLVSSHVCDLETTSWPCQSEVNCYAHVLDSVARSISCKRRSSS